MKSSTVLLIVGGVLVGYLVYKASNPAPAPSPLAAAAGNALNGFTSWWNKNYEWGF